MGINITFSAINFPQVYATSTVPVEFIWQTAPSQPSIQPQADISQFQVFDLQGQFSGIIHGSAGGSNMSLASRRHQEPHYDVNYPYRTGYEDRLLKGADLTDRPWNMYDIIKEKMPRDAVVVDVGCGTAYKSLKLSNLAKLLIGVEPNEEMIKRAMQNALAAGANNAHFVKGSHDNLPVADAVADLVLAFLAPHTTQEIYRVLKPGGWAVIERVGDRDKVNIKEFFADDQNGPRGQLMHLNAGERAITLEHEFKELFSRVEVVNGFWDTEYIFEELLALLKHTPTIRDFSLKKDRTILDRIRSELMVNGKVRTTQNRVLIVAQK